MSPVLKSGVTCVCMFYEMIRNFSFLQKSINERTKILRFNAVTFVNLKTKHAGRTPWFDLIQFLQIVFTCEHVND